MIYWKKIILSFLTVCYALAYCRSNVADTIVLDKVVAKGVKFNGFSIGAKSYTIDSLSLKTYYSSSLADLIQEQNLVVIKLYGSGGLATVSMRGGSTRNTAIIWNGFNLRSPMNGELNFSSMPAGFIDQISIQPGGSSTMYGSGSASGIIYLSNTLTPDNSGWKSMLNTEIGSFGNFSVIPSTGFSGKLFATRVKVGYQTADNDFVFREEGARDSVHRKMEHASFNRKSLIHQMAMKIGKAALLETDLWYINYFNKIPALTSDLGKSLAQQQEEDLRFAVNFSDYGKCWMVKVRSGFLYSNIHYQDFTPPLIETFNISRSYINEAEGKLTLGTHHTFNLGVNHTIEQGASQGYTNGAERIHYAVFGRYNLLILQNRIALSLESRKEFVHDIKIPLVFSFGSDISIARGWNIKGVISRHFALPIFDDIFWKEDGFARGNPNLKPEYGWNYESGLAHLLKREHLNLHNELTFFLNRMHDLILWLPVTLPAEDESKWTPINIDNSRSKGIEFMGDAKIIFRQTGLTIGYMYSFTEAVILNTVNSVPTESPRNYVPRNSTSVSIGGNFKNLEFKYIQSYTGSVYTDETHILSGYTLGNVQIGYNLKCNIICIDTYLRVRNIFNASYQIISGYAQPPRNFAIGINFKF
jgi:vitamin B12 transporter